MTGARPAPTAADWGILVLICACAALAAVLESLLVPLYVGSTIVPVAILASVVSNVGLPRLASGLVRGMLAPALPLLVWLAVMIVFGVLTRPEGDVILPGGGAQWVSYGVLLGGALAGTVTVVMTPPPTPATRRTARDSPRAAPPGRR